MRAARPRGRGSPAARSGAALHTVPVAARCAAERGQRAGRPRGVSPVRGVGDDWPVHAVTTPRRLPVTARST